MKHGGSIEKQIQPSASAPQQKMPGKLQAASTGAARTKDCATKTFMIFFVETEATMAGPRSAHQL